MILIQMGQNQRIDVQPLAAQIAQHIVAARRADVHQRRLPPVTENGRVALPHVKLNIARIGRKAGQIADQKDAERRRERPLSAAAKPNTAAAQHHCGNRHRQRPAIRRGQAADFDFQPGDAQNQALRRARNRPDRRAQPSSGSRQTRADRHAENPAQHQQRHQPAGKAVHRQRQQRHIAVKEKLYRQCRRLRAETDRQRFRCLRMAAHPRHKPIQRRQTRAAEQQNAQKRELERRIQRPCRTNQRHAPRGDGQRGQRLIPPAPASG